MESHFAGILLSIVIYSKSFSILTRFSLWVIREPHFVPCIVYSSPRVFA